MRIRDKDIGDEEEIPRRRCGSYRSFPDHPGLSRSGGDIFPPYKGQLLELV